MAGLEGFAGTFPYATELFGVYQPLLGWKSRQIALRVIAESNTLTKNLVISMLEDSRFNDQIGYFVAKGRKRTLSATLCCLKWS